MSGSYCNQNSKITVSTICTSVNVRSLTSNWNTFCTSKVVNSDIICLQETWRIKNKNLVELQGFNNLMVRERVNSRGGGVGIYTREGVVYEEVDSPFIEGILETIAIELKIGKARVTIVCAYLPPGKALTGIDLLNDYLQTKNSIILMGDFNINILKNTPSSRHYAHFRSLNNLKVLHRKVTRSKSATCIDHILISKGIDIRHDSSVIYEEIADHFINKLTLYSEIDRINSKKPNIRYNDCSKDNIALFRQNLNLVDWGFANNQQSNPNDRLANLVNTFKTCYNTSCPIIERKFNTRKDPVNVWMDRKLLQRRNTLNKLAKKQLNGTIIDKLRYKLEKRSYKLAIDTAKSKYIENSIREAGTDNSKLWGVLNKNCGLKSSSRSEIALKINGRIITNKLDLVKTFSNFYKKEAVRLKNNLNYSTSDHEKYLIPRGYEWSFTDVSREEVLLIIKKLQNKKSSGFDNISNSIIKQTGDILASPLSMIINDCTREGIFPDSLKIAKIVPIFKKGSPWEVGNYRPISLLPAISKIFEKVINNQLTEFLEDNDILPKTQFGFRKNRSTTNAVELLVQEIQKSKRKKEKAAAIFVDVSKAFDCCNHTIILSKLKSIGLSHSGIKLFESYFSNRFQAVQIDGVISDLVKIEMGVGQGTILGPTLFSLYLYDLPAHLDSTTIQFADDTTVYVTGKDNNDLKQTAERELLKLSQWMKDNGLTINESKTKMIQFLGTNLEISLNGIPITRCGPSEIEKSFNFLGIILDNNLTWKYHIEKVISKLNKGRYALFKFRNCLNKRSKSLLFNSFINSHLRYGISLWGAAKGPTLKKLTTTQKSCIRLLSRGIVHTDPLFRKTNNLKVTDIFKHEMLVQTWRFLQNKLPIAISDNLLVRPNARDLRLNQPLVTPLVRTTNDKNQFDYKLISMINTEDHAALQNIINIKKAKKLIKNKMILKYREVVTCNLPTCRECTVITD